MPSYGVNTSINTPNYNYSGDNRNTGTFTVSPGYSTSNVMLTSTSATPTYLVDGTLNSMSMMASEIKE